MSNNDNSLLDKLTLLRDYSLLFQPLVFHTIEVDMVWKNGGIGHERIGGIGVQGASWGVS